MGMTSYNINIYDMVIINGIFDSFSYMNKRNNFKKLNMCAF